MFSGIWVLHAVTLWKPLMVELIWVLEHLHILILMTMKVSEGNTFLPSFSLVLTRSDTFWLVFTCSEQGVDLLKNIFKKVTQQPEKTLRGTNYIWATTSNKRDIQAIIPVTSITRGHCIAAHKFSVSQKRHLKFMNQEQRSWFLLLFRRITNFSSWFF